MASKKDTRTAGVAPPVWRKLFAGPLGRDERDAPASSLDNSPLADDSINAIIEGEIIPRLLMAHASDNAPGMVRRDQEITATDAQKFAALPLRLEAAGLLEEVDNFLEQGVSVEAILLDLLAPAARTLGEMWESDECDFIDVTMGLWRLQEVMRDVSARAPHSIENSPKNNWRVLFSPVPGDQHQFGALMLDEIFSRAGWNSQVLDKPQRRELLDLLAAEPFDLVGLTITRDCPSASLNNLIKAMRSVSSNPNIAIIIGGNAVNEDPTIVAETGADGTGPDAQAALKVAERLVQSAPVRAHKLR